MRRGGAYAKMFITGVSQNKTKRELLIAVSFLKHCLEWVTMEDMFYALEAKYFKGSRRKRLIVVSWVKAEKSNVLKR